ncbi:dihydroorotase [Helicobacter didelphidarum]|uniref:Dihydroorotase n=1 Tax=Helicobacter didelphidarum TaxID=2040648 RepID=A0A3D8IQD2_9HELI|nr:dihydroorotase [Helicobacter didelphidarum]RDU67479.1 dihydroorotase [Helicobacter didelphidarum]
MDTITLTNPIDMHIHLRQDSLLQAVLPYSASCFSAVLAMPNLNPPLLNTQSVLAYKEKIMMECDFEKAYNIILPHINNQNPQANLLNIQQHFVPIMSLYVHDNLTLAEIQKAKTSGIKILKLYPKGATTNAENGMSEVLTPNFLTLLEEAQRLGMILSIHGESNGFSMDREREFLFIFEELAKSFPTLKIIIEHLSDRHSIEMVHKYPNLFGTITLHHLLLTLDDVIGGKLNPFMFCKPVVKTPKDREAILEVALSGDSKFSFGSDSAPHTIEAKMNGAAGIFNAPILLQALCSLFDKHKKIENLQDFVSCNALQIYDISLPFVKHVILQKKPFVFGRQISTQVGDIEVFMGNEILDYCIADIRTEVA